MERTTFAKTGRQWEEEEPGKQSSSKSGAQAPRDSMRVIMGEENDLKKKKSEKERN